MELSGWSNFISLSLLEPLLPAALRYYQEKWNTELQQTTVRHHSGEDKNYFSQKWNKSLRFLIKMDWKELIENWSFSIYKAGNGLFNGEEPFDCL